MNNILRTLRFRVLSVILVVFIFTALGFVSALKALVTDSFSSLEESTVVRDAARVESLFDANLDALRAVSGDWAIWTETYDFVAGRNPSYPQDNLSADSLGVIGVDMMFFLDKQGRVVYGAAVDQKTGDRIEPSQGLRQTIIQLNASAPQSADDRGTRAGFVQLPDGTAALAFAGISTNDGRAVPNGTLVVGRYIGESAVATVERIARLQVAAFPPNKRASAMPKNPDGSGEAIGRVYSDTSDANTIVSWATIRGLDGKPALVYAITEERTSMQHASQTVRYVGYGLAFFVVLFGVVMGVTVEKLVMRRLTRLHDEVKELSRHAGAVGHVTVAGNDEISDLAVALNRNFDGLAEAEAALKHAADHDYLTGLANRRRLEEDMEKALAESSRSGEPVAYVVMDLDGFKSINDTYGHHCGDAVLIWFADVLRSEVRSYSTIARIGGDEFAIMLTHAGEYEAAIVADRLLQALSDQPCDAFGGKPILIDASVGIAIAPKDGTNIGELSRAADLAMYATKTARAEDLQSASA